MSGRLFLGTTSWSWTDWIKSGFYPAGSKPGDFLAHYARVYDTVEVDSTFYSIPSEKLCARWRTVTPDDFWFSAKVPKLFTSDKALEGCAPEWSRLTKSLAELGPKLRHLVLQFGYFNLQSAIPDLETFLVRLKRFLDECPAPCPLALETRNPKWLKPELFGFLKERKISLVLADQKWMPKPKALVETHGAALLTGSTVYVRLIGDREQHDQYTEGVDRLVIDRSEELKAITEVAAGFLEKEIQVVIYANNRFEGNGPTTVQRLAALLEGRGYRVWRRAHEG
jgi:uncharacterized protein YecE (DUF72 family)